MNQLHILNGDSSTHALDLIGCQGKRIIWREMLSDGPVTTAIGSEEFWATRGKFFEEFFNIPADEYLKLSRDEIQKIASFNSYEEVILWFEFDFFCQINLVALGAYLNEHWQAKNKLSLVCAGRFPHYDDLKGLSEIKKEDLQQSYQQRIPLKKADLEFCSKLWQAFAQGNLSELNKLYPQPPATFEYLTPAFQAHFSRFPSQATGLNEQEEKMLQLLSEKPAKPTEVVAKILRKQAWLGLGDLQYFTYLGQLKACFNKKGEELEINTTGRDILVGKQNFLKLPQKPYYFGGCKKQDYVRNDKGELISVT